MKKLSQKLLLVFSSLLLLISVAVGAQAQGYFVEGQIRWKKAMGVVPMGSGNSEPSVMPCNIFSVAALDAHSQKPVTYTDQVAAPFRMREEEDYYVCRYSLEVPADRGLYILATMGGVLLLPKEDRTPYLITGPWIGGTRSKPPAGYERGFTGHKHVTLRSRVTVKRTVSIVNFELIYISDGPK